MPGELRSELTGDGEQLLGQQIVNGLRGLTESLRKMEGLGKPAWEEITAAQVEIKSAVGSVIAFGDVLRDSSKKHSVKYVSDQFHHILKKLSKAEKFRVVAATTPYFVSGESDGHDDPVLIFSRGGANPNLLHALSALRDFVRSELEVSPANGPTALDDVPSAIEYAWADARIVLSSNSANAPIFPFPSSERDHAQRLEACLVQAEDLAADLGRQRWQVREDYAVELFRYAGRLPTSPGSGNILLADAAARNLRELFAAEQDFLPAAFAARLKTVLQQHIALRPFYPEVAAFYEAVRSGHIADPLPLDAVEHIVDAIQAQTPLIFDPSVVGAIDETATASRVVAAHPEHAAAGSDVIVPPADPLGELDTGKARDFQVAGAVNRLWKVFTSGEKISKSATAWLATYTALSPWVAQVIKWLHRVLER